MKKIISYIERHFDFILLDISAFMLAFFLSVKLRRSMDMPIKHGEMFLPYGAICVLIFLIIDILGHNLNGVVIRGIAKETEVTFSLMIVTWSIYTVVLYLTDAHLFSRAVYLITFCGCYLGVLITRIIWKSIIRLGLKDLKPPTLLLVCDAEKVNEVIKKILPGSYEQLYEIKYVVTNKECTDYKDYFPLSTDLNKIKDVAVDNSIEDAYVELSNEKEEHFAIQQLLKSQITVHKAIGDGEYNYASQYINKVGNLYTLTIQGLNISLVSKGDKFIKKILFGKKRQITQQEEKEM